ncbi:MAG: proprotein convertase P-domain-containing protein, partial [Phycisphaerae bacterium]|nr:proprotein convertase P-domain-containing protein [Phycisphaerae bacterium]
TPYFITAEHCGVTSSNASTVVVYWNYETSVCDGTPDGSLNDFQSGSYFRATYDPSDFTLVELDEMPASDWNVGYAGWDRTGDDASMAVAIHHPGVDEKRISFEYQATSTTTYLGDTSPGDGTHVRVDDWDLGTTEGGSSGSPLFDQNHRVIGQLHGGYAACGNDEPDWYGKFSISWSGGGTSSSRLSDWLDSSGTGAWDVDTISGFGMDVSPGADVEHLGPMGGPFTNPSVVYTLSNHSADSINYEVRLGAGTAPLLIDGGTSLLTGTLPANGGQTTVTVTLDAPESLNAGVYTREVIFDDVTNDREQTRLHTIDVGQILISVAPEQGLETGGPTGGPFNGSINYTVTSERPSPVNVRVSANQSWISLNGVAGPLMLNLNGLGDSDDVLVGISSTAESLSPGIYNATVSFTNLSSGQGDTTRNITLEVGRVVFVAGDVPQSITDHNTTTSTINVPDNFCIGDVDVDINITHTWIGDLTVELESPSGTVVRLHDGTGGSDEDIVTTYDDDGEGTAPDGPGTLADFDYTATAGAWTLTVTDGFGGDTGTLNSWSLSIAVLGVTCPPHAFDGSVSVLQYVTSDITLTADSLAGNPLDYIIESLPSHGILSDPDGGTITSAPYTLLNHGDVTRFTPDPIGYAGNDSFTFSVYDGQASNIATISVTVGGPQLAYEWLLDTSPGWTTQGDWAFGVPGGASGDPSSGHTGNNVYGYNLGGDYDDGLDPPEYLTSLPIDCSGLSDVEVKFWRWLGVEQADYDHARFQASNNGSSWTTIWENPAGYDNSMNETSWSQHAYDISAIADDQPTVYLRWSMGNTDSTVTYHGWNIDDIEIWAVGAGQETCDDGILNQDEVLIDCGGSCPPCDCLNDPDCDDGAFCTGIETCDAYGECRAGDAPCGLDEWCDEGSDSCITYGSGDLDSDGDVDLDDFAAFQICFGQWASGGCEAANMSGDGMIDLSDYTEFTSVLDGPA